MPQNDSTPGHTYGTWDSTAEPTTQGEDLGFPDDSHQQSDETSDQPRRDNWWGDAEAQTAPSADTEPSADWTTDERIDDKARSITFSLLRDISPKLCGTSLDDPEKTPVELSEPRVRPHGEGNQTHTRAARVNERDGYISGGESTSVRLGDVDSETFWSAVELLMGYWVETASVPFESDDTEALMVDAKRMRQKPELNDAETFTRLAKTALTPDESD